MFEKIASEEGYKKYLYKCTGDKWTIGFGFNLEDAGIPVSVADYWLDFLIKGLSKYSPNLNALVKAKKDQGFLRFITDFDGFPRIGYHFDLMYGIPEPVAKYWLQYNISHLQARLAGFDFYDDLDDSRKTVMVDMAYQMGVDGLLRFKDMIKDIKVGAWDCASKSLLDSKYAREDSPNRAKRNAETLRTGKLLLNN